MDSAATLSLARIPIRPWTVRSLRTHHVNYRLHVKLRATQAHAHTQAAQMEGETIRLSNGSLYDVLGLGRGACAEDIKKAYRKLALRFHPDLVAEEEEKERRAVMFMRISDAYAILSDPHARAQYDREMGCAPIHFSALERGTGWVRPQPVYRNKGRNWETDQCW